MKLAHKISELARDDSSLLYFVQHARKSLENITPKFKHGVGIVYEVEGLDLSADRIKKYAQEKILSVTGIKTFPACAKCASLLLVTRVSCPNCRNQSLVRSEIMTHYECEYAGLVEEFIPRKQGERAGGKEGGDANYFCPKCSKVLKKVGIDYGRPGISFKCQDCSEILQYPLIDIVCPANHVSKVDEIDLRAFPVYRVDSEMQGFAEVVDYFVEIQRVLMDIGISSKVLGKVRGTSGVNHVFPLVIESEKAQGVVVDFILEESGLDAKILQKVLRGADLALHKILIFIPAGLMAQLSPIVNPDKIKLFPLESNNNNGGDPASIAEEIRKVIVR